MKLSEERAELNAAIAALKEQRATLVTRRIRDCVERGLTAWQASVELGVGLNYTYSAARVRGVRFASDGNAGIRYDPIEIIPQATVKATAIAYRGKASASQIAAVVGTSRNAIIGHWFRSRQSA